MKSENKTLSYDECLRLAQDKLDDVSGQDPEFMIWEEKTMIKEYGYVFVPATKEFIKTLDPMSQVPGITPILVNKNDSTCIMSPSSVSLDYFLQQYEVELARQKQ